MKTLLAIALSFVTSFGFGAETPKTADKDADPIIGKWRWHDGQLITIRQDGRASASGGATGTWEVTEHTEAGRKYKFSWETKEWTSVDELTLSKDYKLLSGRNNKGGKISAISLAADAPNPADRKQDPFVGRWRWSYKNLLIEIYPNGTARGSGEVGDGVWKAMPTTSVERKYQITWRGGDGIDTITLSADGKKLNGKALDGFKFTAARVE